MNQINENLGLVQLYERREREEAATAALGASSARPSIYSTTESSQLNIDGFIEPNQHHVGTTSLLASSSGAANTVITTTTTNNSNQQKSNRVERLLRTDSTEFVLPFGIDDEELAATTANSTSAGESNSEHQSQQQQMHNVPLTHQDSGVDASLGGSISGSSDFFKTRTITTRLVAFLAWFEWLTNIFRSLRILGHRIRL